MFVEYIPIEIVWLRHVLGGLENTLSDVFGLYECLNFTLGSYTDGMCVHIYFIIQNYVLLLAYL
jgi:hypothetical protein